VSDATHSLPPEAIEALRRTGIRLDRHGTLWHQGVRITHRGLSRALLRWLDTLPDGRPILRLDEHRYAYLEVEDAHLLVLSVEWRGDRVFLHLNDGSEEELDYASLQVAGDDAMYCTVRDGRLRARLTTAAYYALAEGIEELDGGSPEDDAGDTLDGGGEQDDDVGFALCARGRRFAIRRATASATE
jgi:hypothetical protein